MIDCRLEGNSKARVQAAMAWRRQHMMTGTEKTMMQALGIVERISKKQFLTLPAPGPGGLHAVSGHLLQSLQPGHPEGIHRVDRDGMNVYGHIGTRVFYGIAWEHGNVQAWGGKKQKARPFLKPALKIAAPQIKKKYHGLIKVIVAGPRGSKRE